MISCGMWDPKLGLTIDQIKNRFPYAIWDSNLYRLDENPNAKLPRYNLVCDKCNASWEEYVKANAPKNGDVEAWQLRADKGIEALTASVINGLNVMPPRGGSTLTDDEIPIAIQYLMSK